MQQSNVDAEWKPEFLFTAIFGETNQVKCEQLPGRTKEFKPKLQSSFPPTKVRKSFLLIFFFVITYPSHGSPMSFISRDLTYYISASADTNR